MTGRDVPEGEMPRLPFHHSPEQPAVAHDDQLVERLRAGTTTPDEHSDPDASLIAMLSAAAGPAQSSELAGELDAVAAFRVAMATGASPKRTQRPRRIPMISSLASAIGGKLAIAAAVSAAAITGATAAAVTNTLPSPLQDVAHKIGAPAAESHHGKKAEHPKPSRAPEPATSAAASAFGQCQAFEVNGGKHAASPSPQLAALIAAAGGADKVEAYCASVTPGSSEHASEHPTPEPNEHASPEPGEHASPEPNEHASPEPNEQADDDATAEHPASPKPDSGHHGKPSSVPGAEQHATPTATPDNHSGSGSKGSDHGSSSDGSDDGSDHS